MRWTRCGLCGKYRACKRAYVRGVLKPRTRPSLLAWTWVCERCLGRGEAKA